MRITTTLLPELFDSSSRADVAVVIDVLRATSVMTTAIQTGTESIITCRDIEAAFELAKSLATRPLLCGERDCLPIDGFDLGNSPADYTPDNVSGRTLILTTTNGTAAIDAASSVEAMCVASFLNLSAVIETLTGQHDVQLICAGTNGSVTKEDVLLAGAIVAGCETQNPDMIYCDASTLARDAWYHLITSHGQANDQVPLPTHLASALRETEGGRNLVAKGFDADIETCAMIDTIPIVPRRIGRSPDRFA